MIYLILVSLLWAPSFGLVGQYLRGVDSNFVSAVRIVLSLLVFAPFVRVRGVGAAKLLSLMGLGAVQFGLMYLLYIRAFTWLPATEVALFTIFTPLYVTLIDDLLERRISWLFLATAALAVGGTAIIQWTQLHREGLLIGFAVMQLSNLCFALGQVLYRRVAPATGRKDHELMGLLYVGAAVVAASMAASSWDAAKVQQLSSSQWLVLLYLGAIASGVGFFLFNAGARRADVGALAICNNVKIPLAILCSVWVFHGKVDWPRLIVGGVIIAMALAVNEWMVSRRRGSGRSH